MKTFYCDSCGGLVFFENVQCLSCNHALGFAPDVFDLIALEPANDGRWRALSASAKDRIYRSCANAIEHKTCNWLVAESDPVALCVSCRLNEVIPNLNDTSSLEHWFKLELAKRRLIYSVLRLGLPTDGVPEQNRPALRFRFLADTPGNPPVMTGHENGLITLNIAEADDAERERRRVNLREPYRTVLGHMRHEAAHYYWDRLIAGSKYLNRYRELFGDETKDYAVAMQKHYEQGAPLDWQSRFVSAYASSHPWEDWAESWAHYLHIVDTLETAAGFGLRLRPRHPSAQIMAANPQQAINNGASFDQVLDQWLPLTYALNSLNRGMGLPDLYPFVLSDPAIEKLRFIHATIHECVAR